MSDAIVFGATGTDADAFQFTAETTRGFDDVAAALANAIEAAGLRLLNEIDVQKALSGVNRTIGRFRLMFFFHPTLVIRVLEANPAAMIEAPLKLLVAEQPDGTVAMRIAEPTAAFGRYGDPSLFALGRELSATVRDIVAHAT